MKPISQPRFNQILSLSCLCGIGVMGMLPGSAQAQLTPPATLLNASADVSGRPGAIGLPGPHLNVYAEFYSPHYSDDESRDTTMTALTAEYEYRFAKPAFKPVSLGLIGSLYRPDGTSYPDADNRESALDVSTMGVSAGFIARFYMVETPRFAWFTEFSAALVYWQHPFPPGGTPWNGIQRFGMGIKAQVSDTWTLMAGARQFHNSNGGSDPQHNPAYDGLGGYLGVSRAWGGPAQNRAIARAEGAKSLSGNAAGAVFEYFTSNQNENNLVDLYAVSGEYEYHVPSMSWLALIGSMSLYRADGSRPDPNRGLGDFNAGSVGYGFNLGIRPIWQVTDRVALFAEAIGGVQRFSNSYPIRSDVGRLYEPWKFPKSFRYGVGVRWKTGEHVEVMGGYRHLRMDTSMERPDDAPDYEAQGFFVGIMRSF